MNFLSTVILGIWIQIWQAWLHLKRSSILYWDKCSHAWSWWQQVSFNSYKIFNMIVPFEFFVCKYFPHLLPWLHVLFASLNPLQYLMHMKKIRHQYIVCTLSVTVSLIWHDCHFCHITPTVQLWGWCTLQPGFGKGGSPFLIDIFINVLKWPF